MPYLTELDSLMHLLALTALYSNTSKRQCIALARPYMQPPSLMHLDGSSLTYT